MIAKRAIEQGEKLGFRSREPSETKAREGGRVMCRHERTPVRSLYVQGPASSVRFVAYTNELKASAYWEVLDKLLSEKGK